MPRPTDQPTDRSTKKKRERIEERREEERQSPFVGLVLVSGEPCEQLAGVYAIIARANKVSLLSLPTLLFSLFPFSLSYSLSLAHSLYYTVYIYIYIYV